VSEAARVVSDAADPDANIIFGATIDPDLEGQVWVTVVAANFSGVRAVPAPPPEPPRKPAPVTREAPVAPSRPAPAPSGGEGSGPSLVPADRVTRFDLPYPATRSAPSPETVPEPDTPRVFDVESVGTPPRDPDATTVIRRSELQGDDEPDGPEDAA
jgi:cell division protein FtsZ